MVCFLRVSVAYLLRNFCFCRWSGEISTEGRVVHRAENGLRNRKRRGIRALRWLEGIPTERGDDFPRFDGLRFFLGAFCAKFEAVFGKGTGVVAVSRSVSRGTGLYRLQRRKEEPKREGKHTNR